MSFISSDKHQDLSAESSQRSLMQSTYRSPALEHLHELDLSEAQLSSGPQDEIPSFIQSVDLPASRESGLTSMIALATRLSSIIEQN